MQNVLPFVRACLCTVALLELGSVLTRFRHREARREAAWLAVLLALFVLRLAVPSGTVDDFIIPVAVLAATVNLLLTISQRRGAVAWTAAAAVVATALAVLDGLGLAAAGRARILVAAMALLSVPPLVLLIGLQRKTGDPADAVLIFLAATWDAACCLETAGLVPDGLGDLCLAPLLLLIAYMLFEQGYLSPLTTSGYVDRLARQRRLMRQTYARLLDSGQALILQDRLIAAGLLALGAAHEFRDILCAVKLTAQHGRSSPGLAEKDACLDLVAEHATVGSLSAVEYLERLGHEGREEPRVLDARECMERLARMARPAWRPAGITLTVRAEPGLTVYGRPREVEQVLLNLLRNAVDAFPVDGAGRREIVMEGFRDRNTVLLSVRDTAGGMEDHIAGSLFTLGSSGTGSTGIGLYLARQLAARNAGSLSYEPWPEGSCFTLSLPSGSAQAG